MVFDEVHCKSYTLRSFLCYTFRSIFVSVSSVHDPETASIDFSSLCSSSFHVTAKPGRKATWIREQ